MVITAYNIINTGFLHIFHFKIPYFSRLKFPNLSVDFQTIFKGLLHPKMKILSLITYPHVVPNP